MLIGNSKIGGRARLTDAQIRKVIHSQIIPGIVADSPSRIVDEMKICCGDARVDIAVINGKLHGFEIKSEADTLLRLQGQISAYNQVFDTMTIICGENHLKSVVKLIPDWWGIYSARVRFGKVELTKFRCPEINQAVSALALAQLLWKSEMLALLKDAGIKKGISSKPCRELWKKVSETFSTETIQSKVREILKFREWRLDLQQT
ncbi:MAG TPA: sce7726 family protein [Candidatus Aquilonibacter sp.]|nr:sce7726 family protein [Candidatus Aquilonibacter sp.]